MNPTLGLAGHYVHFTLHIFAAVAIVAATAFNGRVLRSMMHIRAATFYSPIVFALGIAADQLSVDFGDPGLLFDIAVDVVRLVAGSMFVVGLFLDSRRVVIRLAAAMRAIGEEFDGLAIVQGARGRELVERGEAYRLYCGPVVLSTIDFALHGDTDEPPTSPRPGPARRGP